jgi:hypothetical protein
VTHSYLDPTIHRNDPALQDILRTSITQTNEPQETFALEISSLLKNLLKLLSEDGVLYLSTNEDDALQLITFQSSILPFLFHHLHGDHQYLSHSPPHFSDYRAQKNEWRTRVSHLDSKICGNY